MKSPTPRRPAALLRLTLAIGAMLVALIAIRPPAAAQEPAPAAGPFKSFLPAVSMSGRAAPPPANPGNPPANPGQPTPVRGGAYFFATDVKTNDAAVAVDPSGGLHVAFKTFVAGVEQPAAYYGYCPGAPIADCAKAGGWTYTSFGSAVDEVQLALTADGRPRILFREGKAGTTFYNYAYLECEAGCTGENAWTGMYVVETAGNGVFDKDNPQRSFTLDPQGRPRFVYVNPWGNGKPQGVFYVHCDTSCANPDLAQWSQTQIVPDVQYRSAGMDYPSLAFTGDGRPRIVGISTYSGEGVGLQYFACDVACDDPASWSITTLSERGGGPYTGWDLALDSQGRPRVVQYQGGLSDGDLGRLLYLACDDGCESADAWRRTAIGQPGQGVNPDLELDSLGRPRVAYGSRPTAGALLGYAWCDGADCAGSPEQWRQQTVETDATLNGTFTPAIPFGCDQQVWSDAIPSLALDAAGHPRIAYDALNSAMCYYDLGPGNGTGYRAEKIWRAARVVFFDQP